MGRRYTIADFEDHIPGSGGIISTIAARVGCDWTTARNHIDRSPRLTKLYENECESMLDMAESTLINSIKDGDTSDAKWYLARKGKARGYADKQELEVSGTGEDGAIPVRFIDYRVGLEGDEPAEAES